jgi:RNA polymerase sigma-70 factor (ECF subfamily)
VSDGGGKRPAALRVVNSAEEVARLVLHIASAKGGARAFRPIMLNGVPSAWFIDGMGHESVMQLDIADGLIRAIFIVRNPDKLAHLNLH